MPQRFTLGRVTRSAGSSSRSPILTLVAATVASLVLGACTYRDPGYSAEAANESDFAVVIRDRTTKWLLHPHSAGYLFAIVGDPEEAEPITYEILDAATCLPIGEATVEFAPERKSLIVIGPDLTPQVGPRGARRIIEPIAKVEECPGKADGWSLWIENHTATVYYVRSRTAAQSDVAYISPRSSKLAIRGITEASTIELLDRDCNVLSTYERTGFAHFRGEIDEDRLIVVPDVLTATNPRQYAGVNQCRIWAAPPVPEPDIDR